MPGVQVCVGGGGCRGSKAVSPLQVVRLLIVAFVSCGFKLIVKTIKVTEPLLWLQFTYIFIHICSFYI